MYFFYHHAYIIVFCVVQFIVVLGEEHDCRGADRHLAQCPFSRCCHTRAEHAAVAAAVAAAAAVAVARAEADKRTRAEAERWAAEEEEAAVAAAAARAAGG